MTGRLTQLINHGTPAYSPTGKAEKRTHSAGVKVSERERRHYIETYGSVGVALRHLINEDQRRLHEEK